MKVICSMSIMVAAVALLALSVPVPAFSGMKVMSMQEQMGGDDQKMEICNIDKKGMCNEDADIMGFTGDQESEMRPVPREMQNRQARFTADLKIAEIELMEIMEVKYFDLE